MIAIIAYIATLILPGYFFTKIIYKETNEAIFIKSIAFSLSLIVLIIALCLYVDLAPMYFYIGLIASTGILMTAYLLLSSRILPHLNNYAVAAFVIITSTVVIYHFFAGAYYELPADIYIHLEFFKFSDTNITLNNDFHEATLKQLVSKQAQYWYYAISLFANLDSSSLLDLMPYFMVVNITIFLLAINSFSLHIFRDYLSPRLLFICGLLACFFTAMHFGINVFSFIRYYAAAPVILTMIVYFAAIIALTDYLKEKINNVVFLSSSGLFFLIATMLHRQEAMFIALAFLLMPICSLYSQKFLIKNNHGSFDQNYSPIFSESRSVILMMLSSAAFLLIYIYSVKTFTNNEAIYPKLISLQKLWAGGKDFFALNPKFQFYTVLTHWGVWLYFLYIVFYRRFNRNIYIRALMLVPLVTVFNPLFVHFFLRVTDSHVLWRFLYMLPIHFVAAYITVCIISNNNKSVLWLRSIQFTLIVPLFVFLFPLNYQSIDLPYSRYETLKPVDKDNSYENWQDMIDFLRAQPETKEIISDPVTGYLVSSMTSHISNRYKFTDTYMQNQYLFKSYDNDPFEQYSGSLFILNLREGESSISGKVSEHWPSDVLKTKQYYNDALIQYLNKTPNRFTIIFNQGEVKIYEIK